MYQIHKSEFPCNRLFFKNKLFLISNFKKNKCIDKTPVHRQKIKFIPKALAEVNAIFGILFILEKAMNDYRSMISVLLQL